MSGTIVFCHGAWDGGWFWKDTAAELRRKGFDVYAPSLTGLGDRIHLGTPETNLDTHIEDIVNLIRYEQLRDVYLIGHSYGGMVATGAADRVPERIREIVYLDAYVPEDGQSIADFLGGPSSDFVGMMQQAADAYGGGWRVPYPGEAYDERLTAQPGQTFLQPIKLTNADARKLPRTYVACTARGEHPVYTPIDGVAARAREAGWRYYEIAAGHNLNQTSPEETLRLLLEICGK